MEECPCVRNGLLLVGQEKVWRVTLHDKRALNVKAIVKMDAVAKVVRHFRCALSDVESVMEGMGPNAI